MARKAREKSSRGIYHVILRGTNRQSIFEDEEDRQTFIATLAKYKEVCQYRLFAYCLMDNHVHILLQEFKEPISMIIQRISSSYVFWYNFKHERCGHLFQERFKSEPVETDEYFLTVLRYIHQNPLKANMVTALAEYQWSSYGEYAGVGRIIDKEYVLKMFSDKPAEALKRFVQFTGESNQDLCLEVPESRTIIRDDELRQVVKTQFGIEASATASEPREQQEIIVKALKAVNGANIRQIARVVGLSPTRVWKI